MGRKKKEELQLNVPEDFVGEVVATVSKGNDSVVTPITQQFGNGDMNVLRDKINEIITKR